MDVRRQKSRRGGSKSGRGRSSQKRGRIVADAAEDPNYSQEPESSVHGETASSPFQNSREPNREDGAETLKQIIAYESSISTLSEISFDRDEALGVDSGNEHGPSGESNEDDPVESVRLDDLVVGGPQAGQASETMSSGPVRTRCLSAMTTGQMGTLNPIPIKDLDRIIWSIPAVLHRYVDLGDHAKTSSIIERVSRKVEEQNASFAQTGLLQYKEQLIAQAREEERGHSAFVPPGALAVQTTSEAVIGTPYEPGTPVATDETEMDTAGRGQCDDSAPIPMPDIYEDDINHLPILDVEGDQYARGDVNMDTGSPTTRPIPLVLTDENQPSNPNDDGTVDVATAAPDDTEDEDNIVLEVPLCPSDSDTPMTLKILVTQLSGFELHECSMVRVQNNAMLNCEVVNCYIDCLLSGLDEHLQSRIMLLNSWHVERYRVLRWDESVSSQGNHDFSTEPHLVVQRMCQKARYSRLFECSYIIMPIHVDESQHWVLCIVSDPGAVLERNGERRTCVFFLDSFKNVTKTSVDALIQSQTEESWRILVVSFLRDIAFYQLHQDTEVVVDAYSPLVNQQQDTINCGVFLCYNVKMFLKNPEAAVAGWTEEMNNPQHKRKRINRTVFPNAAASAIVATQRKEIEVTLRTEQKQWAARNLSDGSKSNGALTDVSKRHQFRDGAFAPHEQILAKARAKTLLPSASQDIEHEPRPSSFQTPSELNAILPRTTLEPLQDGRSKRRSPSSEAPVTPRKKRKRRAVPSSSSSESSSGGTGKLDTATSRMDVDDEDL
ncbi:cysteine proteinase [Schizopora paradoxa]|uniref:Cysteine proteinase n=1 Tax=Schizopora paradoxa TaxID=27342 RepID=A0A0H2R0A0_9AGAM|nr:cysteine proteinase [Schizopora paradoxa]